MGVVLKERILRVAQEAEANHITLSTESILGYMPIGQDGIIFIVDRPLSTDERKQIIDQTKNLASIHFLTGVQGDTLMEDPNIVQRLLMYGGLAIGWQMASGSGDWQKEPTV